MHYVRGAVGIALAVASVGVGCALVEGGSVLDAGPFDGGADVHVFDAAPDRSEASTDAGADVMDAAPLTCPQDAAGPPMVAVGAFCIDSTEISNEQYEVFRTQDAGAALSPRCAWNTDLTAWPWNASQKDRPAGVDFCDAYMYCAWAGKHLCGGPNGAALAGSGVGDPTQDLWVAACTGGGQTTFPYGNTYDNTLCACESKKGGTSVDVGTLPQCVGGVNGLYDMSGNVWEWIDACAGNLASDLCVAHGGDYTSFPPDLQCNAARKVVASVKEPSRGFRCCAEPR